MINEAAINAVKTGREYVNQKDLFDAVEQVLVGKEKKDRIMSKEERKIVSYPHGLPAVPPDVPAAPLPCSDISLPPVRA